MSDLPGSPRAFGNRNERYRLGVRSTSPAQERSPSAGVRVPNAIRRTPDGTSAAPQSISLQGRQVPWACVARAGPRSGEQGPLSNPLRFTRLGGIPRPNRRLADRPNALYVGPAVIEHALHRSFGRPPRTHPVKRGLTLMLGDGLAQPPVVLS